ncbi:MAG: sulfatase [Proteobacteria bacterium]|nr:sulfatase [Pseudomonadota bacterium]
MLSTLLLACSAGPVETSPVVEPDVVVIVIDTLRPDHLPTYGAARPAASFLGGLAKDGHVFERAWSASSWTAPSTASLYTALHPPQHGVTLGMLASKNMLAGTKVELNSMSSEISTLPEILKGAGFTTQGAATNINIGEPIGFTRGFDEFLYRPRADADTLFTEVAGWKERLDTDGRSFVYLHLNDVHAPYEARAPWYEKQDDWLADQRALYDSEIGYLDDQLAQLYATMEWEDDLVIVLSDHGEEFAEHGRTEHPFQLHRETNRIVLMAHGPGIESGRTTTHASMVDLLPTLCELSGAEMPSGREGRSLVPALSGGTLPDEPVFAHRRKVVGGNELALWAIIEGDRRLIQGDHEVTGKPGEVLLYSMDDLRETNNLASSEDHSEMLAKLDAHKARMTPFSAASSEVEYGAQTIEMLRELGYVE